MLRKGLLFICLSIFAISCFAATQSPLNMLRDATKSSINALTAYKKQHPKQEEIPFPVIYQIVNQKLLPHVATDYMLRSILARQCHYKVEGQSCIVVNMRAIPKAQWNDLRTQFVYMMVNLYASALGEADQYKVRFRKSRRTVDAAPGAMMEIESQVILPGTAPVTITYQMIYQNNQWQVYDFSINGAISVVSNLRAQFAPTIQQKGIVGLLAFLKKHNADVRTERAGK